MFNELRQTRENASSVLNNNDEWCFLNSCAIVPPLNLIPFSRIPLTMRGQVIFARCVCKIILIYTLHIYIYTFSRACSKMFQFNALLFIRSVSAILHRFTSLNHHFMIYPNLQSFNSVIVNYVLWERDSCMFFFYCMLHISSDDIRGE